MARALSVRALSFWALIVAAVLVALAGCTSGGDEPASSAERAAATSSSAPAEPPSVEEFTGTTDEFYVVPDPLPDGAPGDLIRTQRLDEVDGRSTIRVMYHSNDASGRDRAVTGIVTHPTGPAPDDGWPVVSTAHGTTGIAARCAPSRAGAPAQDWGIDGVAVATDYVGLGPEGELHPYLSKPSEGNAVIDAVTAARQIPSAHAGRRWAAVGHSQGGHGALSAHELAAERAPELELVGTVALAPAAMLEEVYGGIDPIVTSILTMMALYGGTSEHPDLEPSDYLTAEAQAAASIFDTGCLDEITDALIPVALAGAFTADPRSTEPAASMLGANDVGSVAVDDVPVLLASGTVDDRVVIDRVHDLFARMCSAGQVTELHVIDGADHGSVIPATSELVTTWIGDRFDGAPPTDDCDAAR